jgi:hypothetical protein
MPSVVPASRTAPTVDVIAAKLTAAGGAPGAEDDDPTIKHTGDVPPGR